MIFSDLHTHTTFCDGADSPEEMVLSAINIGLPILGFSAHSYTSFDERYCIKQEEISHYINEINFLKEKYKDKITILCGMEMDYFSVSPVDGLDYLIGSVHYIKKDGEYITVDDSPEILLDATEKLYGGDIYALCEDYFSLVADVINKTDADIIGHFDLISKFNEQSSLFDERHPRYVSAWKKAAQSLLLKDIPFEINTGAISRGYKSFPYPSRDILSYILENGGKVILNSDSHRKDTLAFGFDAWSEYLLNMGFSL